MRNPTLILMLQLCPRDQEEAIDLMQLIADIEPEMREDVEFCFAVRRDVTDDTVKLLVNIAKKKFNTVVWIRSQRWGQGWPQGPNDLWQDCMMQLCEMRNFGQVRSEAVFTFEPDCCPLRPDWIRRMKSEWERTKEENSLVCGSLVSAGHEIEHINGNAMFIIDIMRRFPQLCCSRGSWDTDHRKLLVGIASATLAIEQMYQYSGQVSMAMLENMQTSWRQPAILHGVKNNSARDRVREQMNEGAFVVPAKSEFYQFQAAPEGAYSAPARLAIGFQMDNAASKAPELLELMAGLETQARDDIEILIFPPLGQNLNSSIQDKFPRCFTINTIKLSNPPEMWQDAMRLVAWMKRSGKLTADGILMMNPDTSIMRKDWIEALISEWQKTKAEGKLIAGHFNDGDKLNSCAIFDPEIVEKHPNLMVLTDIAGSDYRHEKFIRPNTRQSNLIYHIYPLRHITKEVFQSLRKNGELPAIFLGIQGRLGIKRSQELLTQT